MARVPPRQSLRPNTGIDGGSDSGKEPVAAEIEADAVALQEVQSLRGRRRSLALVLYLATGVLVASVAEIAALFSWASSVARPEVADHIQYVASSLPACFGVAYTLALAAAYVPTSAFITTHTNVLARAFETHTPKKHRKWLARHGLELSGSQGLARVAAVLGPALFGGPVNALLQVWLAS